MTEVGRVTDGQGNVVIVGIDGERVTLQTHGTVDLTGDLADLFGKPRPLGDFADVFATDDVGERLKSFLSPGSGDANWAPSRHIDKDDAVPVTAGE